MLGWTESECVFRSSLYPIPTGEVESAVEFRACDDALPALSITRLVGAPESKRKNLARGLWVTSR